jgi:hypothetical protein
MGDGPISFLAIAEFAKIYEVEEFEEFLYVIRSMDNEYLKLTRKENGERNNKNSKNKGVRRR